MSFSHLGTSVSLKHTLDKRNCHEMKRPSDVLSANLLKVSVTSCMFGAAVPEMF